MEGLKLNSPSQNVHLVCFQSQSKLLDLNILCSLFIFFICELCSRKEKVELFSGFMIMITRLGCAFFFFLLHCQKKIDCSLLEVVGFFMSR